MLCEVGVGGNRYGRELAEKAEIAGGAGIGGWRRGCADGAIDGECCRSERMMWELAVCQGLEVGAQDGGWWFRVANILS